MMIAGLGVMAYSGWNETRKWLWRDRWGRNAPKLREMHYVGASPVPLLLQNSSEHMLFVSIGHDMLLSERVEFLLPGDEQWVELPSDSVILKSLRVTATILDVNVDGKQSVGLPAGWNHSRISVDEEGDIGVVTKPGGDTLPRRHLVNVETWYRLPVQVELPYEAHELPRGERAIRKSWIGPGTGRNSIGCAYSEEAESVVNVTIAESMSVREVECPVSSEAGYVLRLASDMTVTVDELPLGWRAVKSVIPPR